MKIAHVTDFYLPRLGGIEMHVSDLARLQGVRGADVVVVTSSPGPQVEGVHRVTERFRTPRALHPLAAREGIRLLRDLDVDVVHAHLGVASPLAFFVARAAARAGIPTVVTVHSMWAGVGPIMSMMDALGGWSGLPLVWTAVSEAAAAPVRALLPETTVSILANGIDQQDWLMPAHPETPGELVVVAVMRLARRKRPLALLRIVRKAQAALDRAGHDTRLRLVVVGDGPRLGAMEAHARRHGMSDNVTFLGRLERHEVRAVLGSAHVFLAPADLESFGIAALEARCVGLPVVAKSAGGVGEFVRHEGEGLLCGSDDEMTEAIVRLARDTGLRRQLAEHNRTTVCPVAWELLLNRTTAAYTLAREAQVAASPQVARLRPEWQSS